LEGIISREAVPFLLSANTAETARRFPTMCCYLGRLRGGRGVPSCLQIRLLEAHHKLMLLRYTTMNELSSVEKRTLMYDIVVVGGGPAGVTAALRARELGAEVALIERDRLGGTCTNDGCVPTRVLAKAARLMRDSEQFGRYGLVLDERPKVDFAEVMRRTKAVVDEVHDKKQLETHLEEVGIAVYNQAGDTHFVDAHTLQTANYGKVTGQRFVLCVGGHARQFPFDGGEYALTSSTVWDLQTAPEKVVIVGAGATGCQFASVFEDFGAKVTILDIAPRILVTEDKAISDEIGHQFQQRGIHVETGIQGVNGIEKQGELLRLQYVDAEGNQQAIECDGILASIGWPGNINHLGLDQAGVESNHNYVVVNDYLQTSASHIYAAGDITGRSMLVQSAGYQARIAVENALLDYKQAARERLVPHGGFTDPEYGGVGLTEQNARLHHDVVTATVPYADLDRAVIDDRKVGFCKLIVDRRNARVLGAHVVGEQAVEIVSMVSAGMAGGLHVQQLADLELAYPTFVAIVGLAARQIAKELGSIPVIPEWRELKEVRGAEWERSNL
jgi:pyruvate/2-oxoglutarate dehydrogenase complex dihydrolipoamide dehydrogenase (E3) component